MLGIILGIVAFVASLVLDWKASIAQKERANRKLIGDLLRTADSLEQKAAGICDDKAQKLKGLANQARFKTNEANNIANRLRGEALSAAYNKTQADNLRAQAYLLSNQSLNKPTFWQYLRQFQFKARTIASKALAGLAALGAISSIITILQNELEKINNDANKILNEPCDDGSGPSNLSIDEVLEILDLE